MKRSLLRSLVVLACGMAVASGAAAAPPPPEDAKWIRVDTEHFSLLSNASERRTTTIGRNLEQLRRVLEETTQGFKLHSPLDTRIYVFADEASFTPFKLDADGKPSDLAGYFVGTPDGNYVALDASAGEKPFPVIYHEFLHYVMENTVPSLPLWLDEGLAEFYSSFVITGGRAQIGLPLDHHLAWLAGHPMIPLRELFEVDHDSPHYNETERIGTFYAQSWALTHFLVAGSPERRSRFGRLFAALARGVDSRTAFEQAFEIDLVSVEQQLVAYLRASSYTYIRYTPPEEFEIEAATARPLERKEVLLNLGDLLAHRPPIQFDEAERHLRLALAIDPELAEAWIALGFLRMGQDRPAEAVEMCERALALDAGSARAHALLGRSLFAGFAAGMSETTPVLATAPPVLLRAREAFRQSLELRPEDPETLAGLGRTYLFDREQLKEGLSALARASAALPARVDLLRDLIVLTANSGNRAGARRLLDGPLRQRGDAEDVRMVEHVLAWPELERAKALAEQGQVDEARAVLETLLGELQDHQIRANVSTAIAALGQFGVSVADVDAYNRAADAGTRGDLEQAAKLFEALAAGTADPAMRSAAAAHAADLRGALVRERHVAAFNAAIDKANAGDHEGAIAGLEALLADSPEAKLETQARRILDDLRARAVERPGGGKRKAR